jgi:hypothetical protein
LKSLWGFVTNSSLNILEFASKAIWIWAYHGYF